MVYFLCCCLVNLAVQSDDAQLSFAAYTVTSFSSLRIPRTPSHFNSDSTAYMTAPSPLTLHLILSYSLQGLGGLASSILRIRRLAPGRAGHTVGRLLDVMWRQYVVRGDIAT